MCTHMYVSLYVDNWLCLLSRALPRSVCVHTYAWVCAHMCMCMYIRMCVSTYICMCMYINMCMYVHTYVCVCYAFCLGLFRHLCACTYVCVCVVHVHTCVCVVVHVHMCVWGWCMYIRVCGGGCNISPFVNLVCSCVYVGECNPSFSKINWNVYVCNVLDEQYSVCGRVRMCVHVNIHIHIYVRIYIHTCV